MVLLESQLSLPDADKGSGWWYRYRRAEAQKDRITLSTETYSNGYVTISLAKAYFDASDAE